MERGSLALKGRMLAALLGMVVLNAAFVLAVAWSYLVVLPTVFGGAALYLLDRPTPSAWELAQLPLAPRWLALLTVAFLAAQVYYGYTRVLDDVRTSTVGPEEYPQLHGIVDRLAATADVPMPAVSVVAGSPNSFTVGRGHATTLVVTDSLLDLLDARELEAVLAHEVAHVRHRDVTLMTLTGLFVAIAERALAAARLLRRGVTEREGLSTRQKVALDWLLPVAAFTYVFVAPIMWLFPRVARFASGELSRQREFAADRAAAELTGAPIALARALIRVHGAAPDVAVTDLRHERASLQALCVVPAGVVGSDARRSGATTASESADASVDGTTDDARGQSAAAIDGSGAPAGATAEGADGQSDAVTDTRTGAASEEPIDPATWLGTSRAAETTGARTHPPIDRRVERLLDLTEP